jgi:hypothetical protein
LLSEIFFFCFFSTTLLPTICPLKKIIKRILYILGCKTFISFRFIRSLPKGGEKEEYIQNRE